jgi:hypothetical protein
MAPISITVKISAKVDPAAWGEEFGVPEEAVRADVVLHLEGMVRGYLESLGLAPVDRQA